MCGAATLSLINVIKNCFFLPFLIWLSGQVHRRYTRRKFRVRGVEITHGMNLCFSVSRNCLAISGFRAILNHAQSLGLPHVCRPWYGSLEWACHLCPEKFAFWAGLIYQLHVLALFVGVAEPLDQGANGWGQPINTNAHHCIWREFIVTMAESTIHPIWNLSLALLWLLFGSPKVLVTPSYTT